MPDGETETPSVVYHNSIFSPELASATKVLSSAACPMPDSSVLQRSGSAAGRATGACGTRGGVQRGGRRHFRHSTERLDERMNRVLAEVHRAASGCGTCFSACRSVSKLTSRRFVASGQPDGLWYPWSVTEPLNSLENRLPEVAALGEWEELILSEWSEDSASSKRFSGRIRQNRRRCLLPSRRASQGGRKAALIVKGQAFAEGLKWTPDSPSLTVLDSLPSNARQSRRMTWTDSAYEHDCIVHHAFDPHDVLTALSRMEPRRSPLLLRKELDSSGSDFCGCEGLSPIIGSQYHPVSHLPPGGAN